MSENSDTRCKPIRIGLLGASFDTGNMGVNALAESSIKIIINRWPNAEITLLGEGDVPAEHHLSIMGREISVPILPIRFCRNIFLPYHFLWFAVYSLAAKIPAGVRLRKALIERNRYCKVLFEADFVADITGGDSFSDIYGFRRFLLGFLCKWLVLFERKKLVLLPQTYGPFKSKLSRSMAKYILKHAGPVFSRDRESLEYVKNLLNNPSGSVKVRFAPDVAFVLDSRRPDNQDIDSLERVRASNKILVGLNISGLLFNGGYTRDNMFALNVNYGAIVYDIIDLFMKHEKVSVLLVPHVFTTKGHVENDQDACLAVYEALRDKYEKRVFIVHGKYDQGEIKYIIGMCDFFVGSRMHACIAALSQGIPAVGIAYSKKFTGVFESIGLADCVVDARSCEESEILEKLVSLFKRREQIRKHLMDVMPQVRKDILSIFDNVSLKQSRGGHFEQ